MRNLLSFLIGAVAGSAATLLFDACRRTKGYRVVFRFGPVTEQPNVQSVGSAADRRTRPGCPGHVPHPDVEIALTDSQQTTGSPVFQDKRNNPIPMSSETLEWSTDNSDVLTLTPSADGTSCLIVAAGPLGTASVFLKGTAADGTVIIGTVSVPVTAGPATQVQINLSPPVEQP